MSNEELTDAEIRATMSNEQILLERKLTCEAINGAMAFGYQDSNPPPSDDHWLAPFWEIGRQQAELEARAAIAPSDAAQAAGDAAQAAKPPVYAQGVIENVVGLRRLLTGMLDAGHQFDSADALMTAIEEGIEEAMSDAYAQGEQEGKDRALASAAPVPPAAAAPLTAWQTGTPPTKDDDHDEYIVAVRRKHAPEDVFVFASNYANNYGEEELRDQDGNEYIANGWYTFGHDSSGEFNSLFMPMLEPGDEVIGWQALPKWEAAAAHPTVAAAAAAPSDALPTRAESE